MLSAGGGGVKRGRSKLVVLKSGIPFFCSASKFYHIVYWHAAI